MSDKVVIGLDRFSALTKGWKLITSLDIYKEMLRKGGVSEDNIEQLVSKIKNSKEEEQNENE